MARAVASPLDDSDVPRVHTVVRDGRILGYVAIDSTIGGRARGGLRMVPDLTAEEIVAAARAMTLKYGFLGLPQGGAKGGLIGDPDSPPAARAAALSAFAAAARALLTTGQYVPDADMGTTTRDIRRMMLEVGARVLPRDWQSSRSGDHTAQSCVSCASAISTATGLPLRGARVAIEGFGKVGSVVARLLAAAGARIVAVSTSRGMVSAPDGLNVFALLEASRTRGSAFVERLSGGGDRAALLELPVDWLFPCARFHSIDAANVDRVQARVVCAGANDPVSPEAARRLAARGIVYPPDFISNSGGVLGGTLEFAGVPFARAQGIVDVVVQRRMAALWRQAGADPGALRAHAEADAVARHAVVRAGVRTPGAKQHAAALAIAAYRRRWIPAFLMGRVAPGMLMRRAS